MATRTSRARCPSGVRLTSLTEGHALNQRRSLFTRCLAVFVFAALGAGVVATGWAQERIPDFSAGQGSGRYAFASWTPKTLGELLKGNAQNEAIPIVGHWFVPSGRETENRVGSGRPARRWNLW